MRLLTKSLGGLVALGTALALWVAPAGAANFPPPSGSKAAISLEAKAAAKVNSSPLLSYAEEGAAWVKIVRPAKSSSASGLRVEFGWYNSPHQGLYPAAEEAAMGMSDGKIAWWQDQLVPLSCATASKNSKHRPSATFCFDQSLLLEDNSHGFYYALGDALDHGCFAQAPSRYSPVQLGQPWWIVAGHYSNPTYLKGKKIVAVASTYPWPGTPVTAKEIDYISTSTDLVIASKVTVPKGPGVSSPLSVALTVGYGTSKVAAPKLNLCRAPSKLTPKVPKVTV